MYKTFSKTFRQFPLTSKVRKIVPKIISSTLNLKNVIKNKKIFKNKPPESGTLSVRH
jgi:hypothetical protein